MGGGRGAAAISKRWPDAAASTEAAALTASDGLGAHRVLLFAAGTAAASATLAPAAGFDVGAARSRGLTSLRRYD